MDNSMKDDGRRKDRAPEIPGQYESSLAGIIAFLETENLLNPAAKTKAMDALAKKKEETLTRNVKVNQQKDSVPEGDDFGYQYLLAKIQGNVEFSGKNALFEPSVNTVVALLRVEFSLSGLSETINVAIDLGEDNKTTSPVLRATEAEHVFANFKHESSKYFGYSFDRTVNSNADEKEQNKELTRYYGHSEQAMAFDLIRYKDKIVAKIIEHKHDIEAKIAAGEIAFQGNLLNENNAISGIKIRVHAHSLNEICTTCQHYLFDAYEQIEESLQQALQEVAPGQNIVTDHELVSGHYYQYIARREDSGKASGDRHIAPLDLLLDLVYAKNAEGCKEYINSLLSEQERASLAAALIENENLYADIDEVLKILPQDKSERLEENIDILRDLLENIRMKLDAQLFSPDFIYHMAYYLGRVSRMPNEEGQEIFFSFPNKSQVVCFEQMQNILHEVLRLMENQVEVDRCAKYVKNVKQDRWLDPGKIDFDFSRVEEDLLSCLESSRLGFSGLTTKQSRRVAHGPSTPDRNTSEINSDYTSRTKKKLAGPVVRSYEPESHESEQDDLVSIMHGFTSPKREGVREGKKINCNFDDRDVVTFERVDEERDGFGSVSSSSVFSLDDDDGFVGKKRPSARMSNSVVNTPLREQVKDVNLPTPNALSKNSDKNKSPDSVASMFSFEPGSFNER